MIPKLNNIINVTNVRYKNKYAFVTCTIPNYMDVLKTIAIGQSITTNESFELNFPDFSTQWMLIYYPNGQYDYGMASENARVYIKMPSSDKSDQILRMNIKFVIQTTHLSSNSYPKRDASEFIPNDIKKSWAGPFEIDTLKNIKLKDNLTIKCQFEVIHFEDDKFNSKRSLSDINYPISSNEAKMVAKKNRSESPDVQSKNNSEKSERTSKFKFQEPPRHLKYFPDERHAVKEEYKAVPEIESKNIAAKNSKPYERLSKEPQRLHRNLIFSPDERDEVKEKYNCTRSLPDRVIVRKKTEDIVTNFFNDKPNCTPTPLSSRLSLRKQTGYFQPKTFKSSKCLNVSDILSNAGMDEEDKQKEHVDQADQEEMNMSATSSVHEAVEHDQDQSLNKRISFFEGLSKGKE